jgi:Fe-Mn family superoxide dismutase
MKKRDFLRVSSTVAVGSMVLPLISCGKEEKAAEGVAKAVSEAGFELPDLPYNFDALAPAIDEETMKIHHGKHHAGYVRKLNAALNEAKDLKADSLEGLLMEIGPEDTALRNNGGGHYNHSLFWKIMSPNGGGQPTGDLADAIKSDFGSFAAFRDEFTAAAGLFGSGWAWLCVKDDGKLMVTSTPNQDNPLMKNIVDETAQPILGLDVWEHAYYLNYQNRRGDYIEKFFSLIDWNSVEKNMKAAG